MKIAVVGTIWLNIPPKGYGGTELVIDNLVNRLVEEGHDVTLFATHAAKVKSKVVAILEKPLRELSVSWENISYPLIHLTNVFEHVKNFDIVHMHLNKNQDYAALPFALYRNIKTLFTLHFRIPDAMYKADHYELLHKYRALPFSSISFSQQHPDHLNYVRNVYNSISIKDYPFSAKPKDYFVWLGKLVPIKGAHEAIIAAKKAGVKLVLLGAIEPGLPEAVTYFENDILPFIDGKQIVLYEELSLNEKAKVLGGAKALLNPISWEEPFGLVMIEAQATGTPVIAFRHGAAAEVIQNGVTGFLVNNTDEMIEKMKIVDTLDRHACRTWVEDRFSIETMTKGYVEAYQNVLDNWDRYAHNQWDLLEKQSS